MSHLESTFADLWLSTYPTLDLHAEYRFAPPRRFRLDFAYLPGKVAIEIQGGNWVGGRHSRASGLVKEYEKIRLLASLGWLYYPLAAEDITLANVEVLGELCLKRVTEITYKYS